MSEPTQEGTGMLAVEEAAVRRRAGLLRVMVDSFLRNRTALFGVLVISVFTLAAIAAPVVTEEGTGLAMCKIQSRPWHHLAGWLAAPCYQDYDALMQPPSSYVIPSGPTPWAETTSAAQSTAAGSPCRWGSSPPVGAAIIGITMGLAAGYFGRWTDSVLDAHRRRDTRLPGAAPGHPHGCGARAVAAERNAGHRHRLHPSFARITRANALSLREKEYRGELAGSRAQARGASCSGRYIPNTISPIIVQASLVMSYAILIEASLSFLGLGIQPPTPSWGYMLVAGREFITLAWWLTTFPGLAIFLIVLSWNFIGDGIREALDPRQQRR